MRRMALLAVLCLALSLLTGFVSSPLVAEICEIQYKSEAKGCCGNHQKINKYQRVCCQISGCRPWQSAGYTCEAACVFP